MIWAWNYAAFIFFPKISFGFLLTLEEGEEVKIMGEREEWYDSLCSDAIRSDEGGTGNFVF